jgi:hypothetical protein
MSTVQTKQTNLREKLAELLDFRKMRDRLSGLGLYIGKDRTGTDENLLVRGGANVDDLQIGEITALVGGTAVDVFVYDTSRDSDGGAWRKRTQHTSWYNEELNTATRGGRREFPAVAVIVAEAKKVTIYDGDDPDLSMWMVFNTNTGWSMLYYGEQLNVSGLAMLNGKLCVVSNNNDGSFGGGVTDIDFLKDRGAIWYQTGSGGRYAYSAESISGRNIPALGFIETSFNTIVNHNANDVAMTILPNAPIDEDTGLPVPTIAVATDGGVSVIKDDGTVVSGGSVDTEWVMFDQAYLYFEGTGLSKYLKINNISNGFTGSTIAKYNSTTNIYPYGVITDKSNATLGNKTVAIGNQSSSAGAGLIVVQNNNDVNANSLSDLDDGYKQVAITSKYNTGWMPGDIKLATLSDTTVETIGESSDELVVDDSSLPVDQQKWVGNFDAESDLDSWSGLSGAELSIDNGRLKIEEKTGQEDAYAVNSSVISTVIGQRYLITWQFIKGTNTGFSVRFGHQGPQSLDYKERALNEYTDDGYYSFEFIATGTKLNLSFIVNEPNTYGFLDNVSVRATTELITNGDFSTDVNAVDFANAYPEWNVYNGSASVVSGKAELNGNSTTDSNLTTSVTCVIGKIYTLSADVFRVSGNNSFNLRVSESSGTIFDDTAIQSLNLTNTSEQTATITFTATQETHYVGVQINGVSSTTIISLDNISVRPAEEDRSVNNNGLQIIGEINKTPVASGADLVAYSGFSENNYLVQPYNADLDFGTGDFCVMGWFKRNSNSTYHRIWNRADSIHHHRVEFYTGTTENEVYFYTRDDSETTVVEGTLPLGIWTYLVGVRESGTLKIYENGVPANSTTGVVRDLTSENNAVLQIGESSLHPGNPFDGSIALFRISATVPTDAQIAKIYRDEKALFQDGAQATLYGSSDAVTALAYDEKTELLHVGTSSGRSDFSGLRRINNTTTAITTSISAHNNLIAEQ